MLGLFIALAIVGGMVAIGVTIASARKYEEDLWVQYYKDGERYEKRIKEKK